jgi:hypothetical protein
MKWNCWLWLQCTVLHCTWGAIWSHFWKHCLIQLLLWALCIPMDRYTSLKHTALGCKYTALFISFLSVLYTARGNSGWMGKKKMWILGVLCRRNKNPHGIKRKCVFEKTRNVIHNKFYNFRALLLSRVFFCLISLRTTYFNFLDKENI